MRKDKEKHDDNGDEGGGGMGSFQEYRQKSTAVGAM